jgi:hypothetical protein
VVVDFSFSIFVRTSSGAHSASCVMGTGDSFPGSKAQLGRDAHKSPPSSAEVKVSELYILSPQAPSMAYSETTLPSGSEFMYILRVFCEFVLKVRLFPIYSSLHRNNRFVIFPPGLDYHNSKVVSCVHMLLPSNYSPAKCTCRTCLSYCSWEKIRWCPLGQNLPQNFVVLLS